MTTENEKELKWLVKQSMDLKRKIKEKRSHVKKPPRPERPELLTYPEHPTITKNIYSLRGEWSQETLSVSGFIEKLKTERKTLFPERTDENVFITLEAYGDDYIEAHPILKMSSKGTSEELKTYKEKCAKITKENKKRTAKYSKELREWEELYG